MPYLVHPPLRAQEVYLERTFKFLDDASKSPVPQAPKEDVRSESPAEEGRTEGEAYIVNMNNVDLEYIPYAAAKLLRGSLFDRASHPLSYPLELLLTVTPSITAMGIQAAQNLSDDNQAYINNAATLLFGGIAVFLNNQNNQKKDREQDAFNITAKKYLDIASHLMFAYGYEKKSGTLNASIKHVDKIKNRLTEIKENLLTYFSVEKVDQILTPLDEAIEYITYEIDRKADHETDAKTPIASFVLLKSGLDGCEYFTKNPNRPNGPSYMDFLAHTTTQTSEHGSRSNTLRESDIEAMRDMLKDAVKPAGSNDGLDPGVQRIVDTGVEAIAAQTEIIKAQTISSARAYLVNKLRQPDEQHRPLSPTLNLIPTDSRNRSLSSSSSAFFHKPDDHPNRPTTPMADTHPPSTEKKATPKIVPKPAPKQPRLEPKPGPTRKP